MTKVALYVRVSTEEQAKYGFSVQAQKDKLKDYAKAHKYTIVDTYSDEGVSGGKLERPELNRLLNDIKADKIDMILFIKLDRWFRSVAHYYKIQEILDTHNVVWRATEEDYETETSSGKFKVNIMLSVSQQMKDATSERIKFVFENKLNHGGALNGNQPLGYKVGLVNGKKCVVKDKDKSAIVEDIFKYFEEHQSIHKTTIYVNQKYGYIKTPTLIKRMLTNSIYAGIKKEHNNYCEPYISKERWDNIQEVIKSKNIKCNSRYDYIFSGLLICSTCGRKMAAKYCARANGEPTFHYRCRWHIENHTCPQSHIIQERILEKDLIDYISNYIDNAPEREYSTKEVEEVLNQNEEKISNLLIEKDKITKAYIKSWITEEKANAEHKRLDKEIEKLKADKIIKTKKVTTLGNDWKVLYSNLSRNAKQLWWRSIIKNIVIDSDKYIAHDPDYFKVYFL